MIRIRQWYNNKVFRWSTSRPWNILANAASVLGLVIALLAVLKWDSTAIPVLYLCGLSGFLIVRYLRQERRARYGEAQALLAEAYRAAQESYEYSEEGEASGGMFIDRLKRALDGFAQAMTLIAGSNCRACIVQLTADLPTNGLVVDVEESAQAQVVLRSGYRSRATPTEKSQQVARNTDFLEVLRSREPFFANDLPAAFRNHTYENSKWTADMMTKNDYPYRATIVWPLVRQAVDPITEASTPPPQPLGFLCLDSKRRRAFHPFDSYLCGEFAHTLYPLVAYLFEPARGMIATSAPNRGSNLSITGATATTAPKEESEA